MDVTARSKRPQGPASSRYSPNFQETLFRDCPEGDSSNAPSVNLAGIRRPKWAKERNSLAAGRATPKAASRLFGQLVASRAPRTFLDRELALHTFLCVPVHRAVNLVGASLELHFQFGALAGLYFFGFLLDAFSFDFQRVDGVAGVHGLKHIGAGFVQRDLGWLQLELCLLHLDRLYDPSFFGTGRRFVLPPAATGTATDQEGPQEEQTD